MRKSTMPLTSLLNNVSMAVTLVARSLERLACSSPSLSLQLHLMHLHPVEVYTPANFRFVPVL